MPPTLERQTVEFGSGRLQHRLHVFESNGVLQIALHEADSHRRSARVATAFCGTDDLRRIAAALMLASELADRSEAA